MSKEVTKSHLPKDAIVLTAVIVMERFRFPPRVNVQMLEAPPAGAIPVKNRPRRIGTEFAKSSKPIM